MDLEELANPLPQSAPRNPNADLPRLVPSKKALYGDRQPPEQASASGQPQASVAFSPAQYVAPVQRAPSQLFAVPQPQGGSFLQAGQSALAAPNVPNAPPLFIGFLTNDVSMQQIRNLFTS